MARWIGSSDRSVAPPICVAAGTIGSIASNRNPGEYADGDGGSVTAEAPNRPGDLDRGEQA